MCVHTQRFSCVSLLSRWPWPPLHNSKHSKYKPLFQLEAIARGPHSANLSFSWLYVRVCVCAHVFATFLMHVMSPAAMLELLTADTCPMPPLACPLLWPRPSFMGHHWHSSDWYVSRTQCCSFCHRTNNHSRPAALTCNNVQHNREKAVNLSRNPLFT